MVIRMSVSQKQSSPPVYDQKDEIIIPHDKLATWKKHTVVVEDDVCNICNVAMRDIPDVYNWEMNSIWVMHYKEKHPFEYNIILREVLGYAKE